MRYITHKTLAWTAILFLVLIAAFLVQSFATRPIMQNSNIPPVLESGNTPAHVANNGCDPIVIAMDADGNVYSGRDRIGSLTNTIELKTKLNEVVAGKNFQMIFAGEMDLNHEVPVSPCTEYSVFISTAGEANDSLTSHLIRVFQELGIHPRQVIKDKKKI